MTEENEATFNDVTELLFTGVPSSYEDLYATFIFGMVLFLFGDVICRRLLRIVPSLVGYIIAGIFLGPEGLDVIPFTGAWVMSGNVGLTLLIVQAGLEMDLQILKKIGVRGFIMAVIGSILPISIGMFISWSILGQTGSTVIAIGCCFGPTSAGIAINVLGQCNGILEAPIGQLIVAAAIVDDILALLVLSQLQALTGSSRNSSDDDVDDDIDISSIIIPIISAFSWLFLGGAIALFVAPKVIDILFDIWIRLQQQSSSSSSSSFMFHIINAFRIDRRVVVLQTNDNNTSFNDITENDNNNHHHSRHHKDRLGFSFMSLLILLFALLPATYYTQASYLLGAFLTGLAFCQESSIVLPSSSSSSKNEHVGTNFNNGENDNNNDENENNYNSNNIEANNMTLDEYFQIQFKRIIEWLMRIFFAATIGFQVPVSLLFGNENSSKVIGNGFILSLSLLGKLAVGPLLTPIFDENANDNDDRNGTDNDKEIDNDVQNTNTAIERQAGGRQRQRRWRGTHARDCAVVGFSMAGEAEFAFVVAVFGVTEGLIPSDLYASVVLAILLSTIISPLLLRTTLAMYPYSTTSTSAAGNRIANGDNDDVIDKENEIPYLEDDTKKEESIHTA